MPNLTRRGLMQGAAVLGERLPTRTSQLAPNLQPPIDDLPPESSAIQVIANASPHAQLCPAGLMN